MENSIQLKLFMCINIITAVHSQYPNNLQCLSDLSLDNLLQITKVIRNINDTSSMPISINPLQHNKFSTEYIISDVGSNDVIKALPLFNSGSGDVLQKRTEYGSPSHGWQEQKPSKIQKIFQVSVTSLAFLAFGGYLFCMIVQAIKSKGTTYFHPALMSTTASMEMMNTQSSYKRKKPVYRMKRNTKSNNITHNDNDNIYVTQMDMYNILLLLAEGNVKLK